uniref:Uncharacterized protein n=1 Tax=viral metagenome TaxID=1070528 RepID=A0A6M3JX56_9ZZZZ
MYLDIIDDINIEKSFKDQTFGWKVLHKSNDGLTSAHFIYVPIYPTNKWLDEKDFRSTCCQDSDYVESNTYKCGWHIFLIEEDAHKWRMEKCGAGKKKVVSMVVFRDVITYGSQLNFPIVVAKEMLI